MKKPVRAVLADMDDTVLVHSILADDLWAQVIRGFEDKLGTVGLDELTKEVLKCRHSFWGEPATADLGRLNMTAARSDFVSRALAKFGLYNKELVEDLVGDFSLRREESVQLPSSTSEALKFLRSNGVKLALITNGGALSQRAKVERFSLNELFDTVVIEGEVGVGKPNWKMYQFALDALSVDIDDSVMVGDNWEWEIEAPSSHGMRTIWVHRVGDMSLPERPLNFLGSVRQFSEVPGLIGYS